LIDAESGGMLPAMENAMKPWSAIALLVAGTVTAQAQDKKLQRNQLPAAVAATVDRETQGATVKGFATERENGKRVYEAETVVNGHTRDLQIAENGTLNEIEEEVAVKALPASVRDALMVKVGKGKIVKVESLTKQGKLVAYEASTVINGRKGEIQVGPTGEKLLHEE
jgi:hypothetical protein